MTCDTISVAVLLGREPKVPYAGADRPFPLVMAREALSLPTCHGTGSIQQAV